MNEKELQKSIIDIMSDTFNVKKEKISLSASKSNLDEWDSLAHLKLFLALQESFRVNFSTDEIDSGNSLEKIYKLLKDKIR
ncbi:MAG TPA: acyl carrier protein [Ignavibacteria bacterium]